MSVTLSNVGGTLTGGTSVSLTSGGITGNGNKSVFLLPTSTRLAPRELDFLVTPAKTTSNDPGVARAGLKISFSDRVSSEEGCCTVQQGSVIIDVGVRWHLNQPETLVDEALDVLQSAVFLTAFSDAIKKGVLPS